MTNLVMCWHYSAVRDIPKSTAADAEETLDTTEAQQEQENVGSEVPAVSSATDASEAALLREASQQTMDLDAASDAASTDTERPAKYENEATADPTPQPPSEQPPAEAVAALQKDVVQSFSNEYIRAIIPNIDSMFAENDFSSLDARKRWAFS